MLKDYTFPTRLAAFLAIDVAVTIIDTYIPHSLGPVTLTPLRAVVAALQLGLMVWTMAITMQRVLEDY